MITFPIGHFDIYFRHYLRRRKLSYADYAKLIGADEKTVYGVAIGVLSPPMKILNEMRVTVRSTTIEKCIWDLERVIEEI